MRAIAVVAVARCALLSCARPLAAAEPTVACAVLTPAQIGAATGATIRAGQDDHAEPVGGVGDDAFHVYFAKTTRAGCGIVVKKGSVRYSKSV